MEKPDKKVIMWCSGPRGGAGYYVCEHKGCQKKAREGLDFAEGTHLCCGKHHHSRPVVYV